MSALHLLLADADTLRPALPSGVPAAALRRLGAPRSSPLPGHELGDKGAAPDDLRAQRWGLVVPAGKPERARLVAELVAHREAQQGARALVYEAPPDLDGYAAAAWVRDVYEDRRVSARERPRYLLLLGDLSELSEDLQHALATQAFVGRLALDDEEAYARYGAKIIAAENAPAAAARPRLVLHARPPMHEGDMAGRIAVERLIAPCVEEARREGLEAINTSSPTGEELIEAIRASDPAVLLTVCHGHGAPAKGWSSAAVQRRLQGALLLGPNRVLSATAAERARLLPGGIWFMHSCFGAATPTVSAYAPWMGCFREDEAAALGSVLDAHRPRDGRGFLSALPAALLGNPEGPLAVIGHSDAAWVDTFHDPERPERSSAGRVFEPLRMLCEGRPAGVAVAALLDACRLEEQGLLELYAMGSRAPGGGRSAEAREREAGRFGQAWLGRQNLRGFMLLGDPAARVKGKGSG